MTARASSIAPTTPERGPRPGDDEVVVDRVGERWRVDVAGERLEQPGAHQRQQPRRAAHPAAEDDPFGGEDEDDVRQAEREVLRLQLPDLGVGQLLPRPAPALAQRGPRGEALEAVAVERAGAGEGIALAVVRDQHVADLGMEQAVDRPPVDEDPAADPGADGDVDEGVEPLGGAVAPLAHRGGVDVGVEGDRDAERRRQRRDHVGVAPARLRRRRDRPPARRGAVHLDRAEGADADRLEVGHGGEEPGRAAERLRRRRRREALRPLDLAVALPTAHVQRVPPASIPPMLIAPP